MKPQKSGGSYRQPPAGPQPAILYSLIDLGTQEGNYQGRITRKRKINMRFELHGEDCQMDDGRPMSQGMTFTLSSHPKGALRPFMEAWRSKSFTDEEFEAFDLRKMLGVPCILTLVQDGDYMAINGISKLIAGMAPPVQKNPSIYLSLEPGEFQPHLFDGLSEKMKETIRKSPEYAALTGQAQATGGSPMKISDDVPFDDDIPF
ncbi:phage replication initiation protein, NGO0469 family [Methylobacterium sp. Gmos1]